MLGYRHLPLYNIHGEQFLFSRLFVKIDVDPVTLIAREEVQRASTIDNIKSTAKSVLAGFSADRRSVSRKGSDKEKIPETPRTPRLPQGSKEDDNRLFTFSPISYATP
jgi:hypothetical protein